MTIKAELGARSCSTVYNISLHTQHMWRRNCMPHHTASVGENGLWTLWRCCTREISPCLNCRRVSRNCSRRRSVQKFSAKNYDAVGDIQWPWSCQNGEHRLKAAELLLCSLIIHLITAPPITSNYFAHQRVLWFCVLVSRRETSRCCAMWWLKPSQHRLIFRETASRVAYSPDNGRRDTWVIQRDEHQSDGCSYRRRRCIGCLLRACRHVGGVVHFGRLHQATERRLAVLKEDRRLVILHHLWQHTLTIKKVKKVSK